MTQATAMPTPITMKTVLVSFEPPLVELLGELGPVVVGRTVEVEAVKAVVAVVVGVVGLVWAVVVGTMVVEAVVVGAVEVFNVEVVADETVVEMTMAWDVYGCPANVMVNGVATMELLMRRRLKTLGTVAVSHARVAPEEGSTMPAMLTMSEVICKAANEELTAAANTSAPWGTTTTSSLKSRVGK